MNPTTTTVDPTQAPPPQPPPAQPPRSSFSCDKHPLEQFSGFCPECLCERLTTLDQSVSSINNNPSSSSSSVLKSLFSKPSKPSSFFPELRRSKSFSASKNEALSFLGSAFEPQRKSCDVRTRSTLSSLFEQNPSTLKPHRQEEENHIVVSEITEESPVNTEIIEEEEEAVVNGEALKPMKDHIDLDSQAKKRSFLSAASVFSKKWHNWRRKQKLKKRDNVVDIGKPIRKYSQSEIGDFGGFGRRSCDTEPRFSLDIGRISIDDPRYSFDEPRASCDAHFISRSSIPRIIPQPMVSVIEDAPVARTDTQIPVEEANEDSDDMPGGTAQTRDYYLDSSSRRRKSLDRSNSIRKIVAEIDDMKAANADDFSETFELTGLGDNANGERKGSKKTKKWTWNIFGFIHRKNNGIKDEEEERSNGVERSFSGSWSNGGGLNRHMLRSNSSVSWRNSTNIAASFGNGKKKDEFVLERSRSAKYSPNHVDNGFLRFHFAPMKGSRRSLPPQQTRPNGLHSIGKNLLRLY